MKSENRLRLRFAGQKSFESGSYPAFVWWDAGTILIDVLFCASRPLRPLHAAHLEPRRMSQH